MIIIIFFFLIKKLNVPCEIYAATARDKYRKPMIGIWKYITEHGNDGVITGAYYLLSYSTFCDF